MSHLGEAAWSIAVRTAIIYVVLLVGFRLTGKRQIGQMTPFDLVVILLIANAVQNSMVGHDVSVTGGLIAAAVLLVGNYGLARLSSRVGWLERVVEGEPTLLVRNGKFIEKSLEREDVDKEEITHGNARARARRYQGRAARSPGDGWIDKHRAGRERPGQTRDQAAANRPLHKALACR
jgi:hypothetical protein